MHSQVEPGNEINERKTVLCHDCSVPVLQGIPALLQMIVSSADCLTPMQVQIIAEAVEDLKIPAKNVEISKSIPKPKLIKRENLQD